MKTTNLLSVTAISIGLTITGVVPAHAGEHEEQNIDSSEVPAVVQKAAQTEAKGAKIVRWEREGSNYEAVVDENGKNVGIAINPKGKVLNRHDEAKERKEEGSKY